MKRSLIVIGLVLITGTGLLILANSLQADPSVNPAEKSTSLETGGDHESSSVGDFRIDLPVTEGGLQVFLIRGKDALEGKHYTTLSTAMKNEMITVEETGSVGELQIDNNSDEFIFIHSGDIVKGGKQDRTLAYDMIIPPKAQNVDIQSFCVEQGRWQARGSESVAEFEVADKMLSSKELKLAAKYDADQSKVWKRVKGMQDSLNFNMLHKFGWSGNVSENASSSSLQLTLENEKLEEVREEMKVAFTDLLDTNSNAIGCAYAINGDVMGVDVYNNKQLFEEIWPKLVEAMITETISLEAMEGYEPANSADIHDFMAAVEHQEPKDGKVLNMATELYTTESDSGHLKFSTMDMAEKDWVHRNYLKK